MIIRKLGTLNQLLKEHGPTRDNVIVWAKNEVALETEKYKRETETQLQKMEKQLSSSRAVARLELSKQKPSVPIPQPSPSNLIHQLQPTHRK